CPSGEECCVAAGATTALRSLLLSAPSTTRGLQAAGSRPHPRVRGAEYRSPASESLRHPFQWPRRGRRPWRGHLSSARLRDVAGLKPTAGATHYCPLLD